MQFSLIRELYENMKSLAHVFQIVSLILYFETSSGSEPWSVLPEITGEICPNTCIWKNESVSSIWTNQNVSTGSNYCCKECSCDDDCGLDNNCCFKELDKTPIRLRQRCTITATRELGSQDQAFYMVQRNPRKGCILAVDGMKKGDQCGNVNVAIWGSIYPVLSPSSGTIYRNEKCAICHNDTNYVTWTPIKICRKVGRLTHFVSNALDSAVADNCYFVFHIDGFNTVLAKQQCNLNPFNFCKRPKTFPVPSGWNLSRTDVMNACTSGFRSQVEDFANIFCWICSVGEERYPVCEYDPNINRVQLSIMLLLDPEKIAQKSEVKKEQNCTPVKKKQGNSNECVQLLCPTGQTMIFNKCYQLAKQWRQGRYTIPMTLTPIDEQSLTSTGEQSITNSSMERVVDFFRSQDASTIKKSFHGPWTNHWFIRHISYQESFVDNSSSVHLHIELELSVENVKPTKLIKEIKNSLQSGFWKLKTETESFRFSQEMAKLSPTQKYYSAKRRDIFTSLYSNVYLGTVLPFYISKLFFCRQIVLYQEKFNLTRSEDLLYYKAKSVYLYQHEFEVIYSKENKTARICISDSIYVTSSSMIASSLVFNSLFIVPVLQIAIALCIYSDVE